MPKTQMDLFTQVIGRIGKIELKEYDGTPVLTMSVAGKRSVPKTSRHGDIPCPKGWAESYNGKYWETTVWFRVTAWREFAKSVFKNYAKGDLVFLRGTPNGESIVTDSGSTQNPRVWTGNDGIPRCSYELILTEIIPAGKPASERGGNGGGGGQFAPPPEAAFDSDDPLPF